MPSAAALSAGSLERRLQPDRAAGCQRCASGWKLAGRIDAERGDPPVCRRAPSFLLMRIDFAQLYRASIFQVRALFRGFGRSLKVRLLDNEIPTDDFLRFCEWAVDCASILHRDQPPAGFQLIA